MFVLIQECVISQKEKKKKNIIEPMKRVWNMKEDKPGMKRLSKIRYFWRFTPGNRSKILGRKCFALKKKKIKKMWHNEKKIIKEVLGEKWQLAELR